MGQQGFAALGVVVVAVALLAVPMAVFDGPERGDDQHLTVLPRAGISTTWPTEVPEDLDLAIGMASNDGGPVLPDGDGRGPQIRTFCDRGLPDEADRRLDELSVAMHDADLSASRSVTLYADDGDPGDVLAELLESARECRRTDSGPGSTTLTEVRPWDVGDEAFIAIRSYQRDGAVAPGAEILHFARAGNALLVASTYSGWVRGPALEAGLARQSQHLGQVVDQMCAFTRSECDQRP